METLARLKETLSLRLFAYTKIPMLAYIRPKVIQLDESRCVIRLPLNNRSRNHLGSMYFGALCAGADLAGGLAAMRLIQKSAPGVAFVFKDFDAQFLKRAEGAVFFTCDDGVSMLDLVTEADRTGERVEEAVNVVATVPDKLGDEPVAKFRLTISLKKR